MTVKAVLIPGVSGDCGELHVLGAEVMPAVQLKITVPENPSRATTEPVKAAVPPAEIVSGELVTEIWKSGFEVRSNSHMPRP